MEASQYQKMKSGKGFTRQNFLKKNSGGFTLLEMMIAIFVIVVGLIGAMSLIHRAIVSASISSSRLIAAYLAQEGIEIVRNIRDGNWLEQRSAPAVYWDDGLGSGDWEIDYKSQNLTTSYQGRFLNIDTDGFYSYSPGAQTKFKRKIKITKESNDILNVLVQISWEERGMSSGFSLRGKLYNWR